MATKLLTKEGKEFIRNVGNYFTKNKGDKYLLTGQKNYRLPVSNQPDPIVWNTNVIDIRKNAPIVNNSQFIEYIIYLFDLYATQYDVDANIIAAQSFQESEYICWNYAQNSSASGISQFIMKTMYELIYNKKWLTQDEKNKILLNFVDPTMASSWVDVEKSDELDQLNIDKQKSNHAVLHQNIINHPDISIKLQCRLVDYIAKNNNNLASSVLFCYNRGSELKSTNYVELVNRYTKNKGEKTAQEGLYYAESIFGYLGDKDHQYIKTNKSTSLGGLKSYTKGYFFNYQIKFGFNDFFANSNSSYSSAKSVKNSDILTPELRSGYNHAKTKFELTNPGYKVSLTSVYRSPQYQNELYQVGRNPKGEIIGTTLTPVSGIGKDLSKHNYLNTLAFDYGIYNSSGEYLDGRKYPQQYKYLYEQFANYVLEVAPNAKWGGNFTNQKNDVVHIQV
jgi:hypothetical protein